MTNPNSWQNRMRSVRDGARVALRLVGGERALPAYLIIGAQKAGTSSLFHYLGMHPGVLHGPKKEIHFFDLHYRNGPNWYRSHFPRLADLRPGEAGARAKMTGESSPYYMFHPAVPSRVHDLLPGVRLVALLRNPVTRAFSHYCHEVQKGRERRPLSEAITGEDEALAGEMERLLADPEYDSVAYRRLSYRARGVYVHQLRRWMAIFPRNQLLVVKSEDLFADPETTFAAITDFLGLERWSPSRFPIRNARAQVQMEFDPTVREALDAYYAPFNQELSAALGRAWSWT